MNKKQFSILTYKGKEYLEEIDDRLNLYKVFFNKFNKNDEVTDIEYCTSILKQIRDLLIKDD